MNFFIRIILTTLIYIQFLIPHMSQADNGLISPVQKYGSLKVKDRYLLNKQGEVIQLRGISSFWLNWLGEFSNPTSIKGLKEEWGISLFRAAMGVEPKSGYLEDPITMVKKVDEIIQTCINLDIYVIVDYHAHEANKNTEAAKKFFRYIAKKYGKYPHIIYEIWNEPLKVSWKDEVRPYMQELIQTIRKYDSDNLILVGSPHWCQHIEDAFHNPVDGKNIMYTTHFYTGSAREDRMKDLDKLWNKGCPIFVSEFGVSIYDGGRKDKKVYLEEADEWIDWMNKRKISWVAWSLCDKNEASALLKPGSSKTGPWRDNDLSKAGVYIKKRISN